MVTEFFDPEITLIIIGIEKKYGFEENYLLLQLYKLMKYDPLYYESENERRANDRRYRSNIKKKYKDVQKKTEALINALKQEPHVDLPSQTHNDLMSTLQKTHSETVNLISSMKDSGGRPSSSKQQFLIFHLVRIYRSGTKKSMKCYYSSYQEADAGGETYEFLIEIKTLFSKIDNQLKLGSNASIRKYANALHDEFDGFDQYIH